LGLKNVAVVNPVRVELRNDQRSSFDGVVHRHGGALIFELEPRRTSEERYVQNAASNIGGALEISRVLQISKPYARRPQKKCAGLRVSTE
jgi:light-regulated signal transduction histidine kinase (bacteriophytochrome)